MTATPTAPAAVGRAPLALTLQLTTASSPTPLTPSDAGIDWHGPLPWIEFAPPRWHPVSLSVSLRIDTTGPTAALTLDNTGRHTTRGPDNAALATAVHHTVLNNPTQLAALTHAIGNLWDNPANPYEHARREACTQTAAVIALVAGGDTPSAAIHTLRALAQSRTRADFADLVTAAIAATR